MVGFVFGAEGRAGEIADVGCPLIRALDHLIIDVVRLRQGLGHALDTEDLAHRDGDQSDCQGEESPHLGAVLNCPQREGHFAHEERYREADACDHRQDEDIPHVDAAGHSEAGLDGDVGEQRDADRLPEDETTEHGNGCDVDGTQFHAGVHEAEEEKNDFNRQLHHMLELGKSVVLVKLSTREQTEVGMGMGHHQDHGDEPKSRVEPSLSKPEPADHAERHVCTPVLDAVSPHDVADEHGDPREPHPHEFDWRLREGECDDQEADEVVDQRDGEQRLDRRVVSSEDDPCDQIGEGNIRSCRDCPAIAQIGESTRGSCYSQIDADGPQHTTDRRDDWRSRLARIVEGSVLEHDCFPHLDAGDCEEQCHQDIVHDPVRSDDPVAIVQMTEPVVHV